MNYVEIVDQVIAARFKEAQREKVQRWVKRRYSLIWAAADWTWKLAGPANMTVTAGDDTPTLPAGVRAVRHVFDDQGGLLAQMMPEDFDFQFRGDQINGRRGTPTAWKLDYGVITLGPIPSVSATYSLSYDRKVACLSAGGSILEATLTNDTDLPIWDNRDFDYLLVPGAIATGLKEENDPTWQDLETEFREGVNDLREYYLPATMSYGNMQYGADRF